MKIRKHRAGNLAIGIAVETIDIGEYIEEVFDSLSESEFQRGHINLDYFRKMDSRFREVLHKQVQKRMKEDEIMANKINDDKEQITVECPYCGKQKTVGIDDNTEYFFTFCREGCGHEFAVKIISIKAGKTSKLNWD